MATHSSILTWRIPWSEEPDKLQSMELQRVGHDELTHITLCLNSKPSSDFAGWPQTFNSLKKKKKNAISAKPDKAKCNKARYACILSHFTLLWFLISFTPPQLSLIFLVAIIVITRAQSWDSGPLQASPRCHCYAMWLSKSTSAVASVSSSV